MIKRFLQFLFLWTVCISAYSQAAGITDVKFGRYQIADSQWNVSACMQTSTCQIYSTNPGTAYKIPWTNGQIAWATGDYIAFVKTGNATNPYNAIQYGSNGVQKAVMGTGRIINMGVDASGKALFFFVGNDNNTGQLFSQNAGLTGTSGYTWTGTLNPTVAQVDSFSTTYGSSTPLAAGQTYSPVPTFDGTITQTNNPSNQTITSGGSSSAGISGAQQTRVNTWINSAGSRNLITVDQVYGSNNTVEFTQTGNKNEIDFSLNGNNNVIKSTQTGSNYLKMEVPGWGNTVTTNQNNTTGTHYTETRIQGNGNTVNHTQTGNANKILFSVIQGDINTLTTSQTGTGAHLLETKMTGNFNSIIVDQNGSTANKANIDITNAGGAATVDLIQSGGKNFTIIQSCVNPAGCSTVVRQ